MNTITTIYEMPFDGNLESRKGIMKMLDLGYEVQVQHTKPFHTVNISTEKKLEEYLSTLNW